MNLYSQITAETGLNFVQVRYLLTQIFYVQANLKFEIVLRVIKGPGIAKMKIYTVLPLVQAKRMQPILASCEAPF